ncbi:MAG: hypothetical protein SPI49_03450 [Eubacteriales bacterium]|nr:hypothetical protein [Eubacteriales bacterium]
MDIKRNVRTLQAAIIEQATKDYYELLLKKYKIESELEKIEAFFKSNDFEEMNVNCALNCNGENLMNIINVMVQKESKKEE